MEINNIIKKIKKCEAQGHEVSIIVKNINTNEEGIGVLTINGDIKIFEGADDGSDDKIYTLEEFKRNYRIIRLENEYEQELE